jgi:4-hydroxybenzoate polyprenyltransferase
MVLGIAVLVTNGVAAAWGGISYLRGRPSRWFWPLLRVAQATVATQVVLGLILAARGADAPDGLHIVYGVAPLVVTLFSEGFRATVALRVLEDVPDVEELERAEQIAIARRVALAEMGVMTVGLLLILTLALLALTRAGVKK